MNENTRKRTLNLTLAALFTAVTAVLSQTAIPTPFDVPLTLQTFAVALCGYTLGIKWGLASILTYILLGTAGVPVFSGFRGGVQVLFGATGGFNAFLRRRRAYKKQIFKGAAGYCGAGDLPFARLRAVRAYLQNRVCSVVFACIGAVSY